MLAVFYWWFIVKGNNCSPTYSYIIYTTNKTINHCYGCTTAKLGKMVQLQLLLLTNRFSYTWYVYPGLVKMMMKMMMMMMMKMMLMIIIQMMLIMGIASNSWLPQWYTIIHCLHDQIYNLHLSQTYHVNGDYDWLGKNSY